MSIKHLHKDIKLPKELQLNSQEKTKNTVQFEIEPFERGLATTVGNMFRRVLLSSIQGYAVTSIQINTGKRYLTSEYESIDGVIEDSIEIIDNIKSIKFIIDQEKEGALQKQISTNFKGKGPCYATIFETSDVSILNKNLILFNASDEVDINLEILVELGRGYLNTEMSEKNNEDPQTISLDAIFSPIDNVNFIVENIRIGHRIDYEKLLLNVTTNGTITPQDAVAQAAKLIKDHMTIFINFNEDEVDSVNEEETKLLEMKKMLQLSIDELELSSRSYNCLRTANIMNIGDLVKLTEKDIQALPNFGSKSMIEIQAKLLEFNFSLGMPLPPEIVN